MVHVRWLFNVPPTRLYRDEHWTWTSASRFATNALRQINEISFCHRCRCQHKSSCVINVDHEVALAASSHAMAQLCQINCETIFANWQKTKQSPLIVNHKLNTTDAGAERHACVRLWCDRRYRSWTPMIDTRLWCQSFGIGEILHVCRYLQNSRIENWWVHWRISFTLLW